MMLVMLNPKTEMHSLEISGEARACIYRLRTEIKSVLEGFFFVWVFCGFFTDQSVREIKREDEFQRLAEK